MPYYGQEFEALQSFDEHDRHEDHDRHKKLACPECGSRKVEQLVTQGVSAITAKKS